MILCTVAFSVCIHTCLQVEEREQWSVPVAVARPHSLCLAAANMLHILDVRADSLSEIVEESRHSRAPIVFEFSESPPLPSEILPKM